MTEEFARDTTPSGYKSLSALSDSVDKITAGPNILYPC